MKPNHSLGLFKNGRASVQVEKRGCESSLVVSFSHVTHTDVVPDLTFCEMAFLQDKNKEKSVSRIGERSDGCDNMKSTRVHAYLPPMTRESGQKETQVLTAHLDDCESAPLSTSSDRADNLGRSVDADNVLPQEPLYNCSMNIPPVTQANVQSEALINESSSCSTPDEIQTSRSEPEYVPNSAQIDLEAQPEKLQNPAAVCTTTIATEKRTLTMDDADLCANAQVEKIHGIGLTTILDVDGGKGGNSQNQGDLPPPLSPLSRLLRDCDELLSYGPALCSENIDASNIPYDDCQPLQSWEVSPDERFVPHSDVDATYMGSSVECKTISPLPVSTWRSVEFPRESEQVARVVYSHRYIPQTSQELVTLNDKTDFEDISSSWHSWKDDLSYTSEHIDREIGGYFGDGGSSLCPGSSVAQTYTLEDKTKTMPFETHQEGNTNLINYTGQLRVDNHSDELRFSWKPFWRI